MNTRTVQLTSRKQDEVTVSIQLCKQPLGLTVPVRCTQVKTAEGFSKRELFEKLAPLVAATRPVMAAARQALAKDKGDSSLQPWNIGYSLSGRIACPV